MKVIAIFFTAVLLYGCSSNVMITGQYGAKSNPDFFRFNAESTYYYKYNAYHVSEYSSGKWVQTNKKTVLLNSSIQSRSIPLKIKQNSDSVNTGYNIELNFDTVLDLKNYKCAVFINDTLYSLKGSGLIIPTRLGFNEFEKELNVSDIFFRYTRCDSLLSLKVNNPIKSIFFKIIKFEINSTHLTRQPLETEKYILVSNNNKNLNIRISLKDSLFNYRVFKNEKLKVRTKGISIFNSNNNTWWYIPKLPDTKKQ